MPEDYRCPKCGVSDTRFRSTFNTYVCNRCGHEWGEGLQEKKGNWFTSLVNWIAAHPLATLIIITVGLVVAAIQNITDPSSTTSTGGNIALVVLAFISFFCLIGYVVHKKNVSVSGEPPSERPIWDTAFVCGECDAPFGDADEFCSKCGQPR